MAIRCDSKILMAIRCDSKILMAIRCDSKILMAICCDLKMLPVREGKEKLFKIKIIMIHMSKKFVFSLIICFGSKY